MPPYVYVILAVGWLVCFSAFIFRKPSATKAQQVKTHARWGIFLEMIAFLLLWQGRFWDRTPQPWRVIVAVALLSCASLLSWSAVSALGRHWRLDAALNPDHRLVRSGPYRLVRHPIYTALLCLLVATGLLLTPWPLFVPALFLFAIGTEIRVRTEDALLASRFGDEFANYRRRVPAYIPFTRSLNGSLSGARRL